MRFFVSTFVTVIVLTGHAFADSANTSTNFFFKPYVGAEYQYTSVDYAFDPLNGVNGDQELDDSLHGGNVHVGARVHKNLGFEVGYLVTETGKKNNILGSGLNSGIRISGFTLDAMGYIPLDHKIELIGTAGISDYTAKLTGSVLITSPTKDSEIKGRIGAGAQYWVTDNLNVRGLVRYQDANYQDTVNHAITANLGVNYQF